MERRGEDIHVSEEISTAKAALKIFGEDIVIRSEFNFTPLALEDLPYSPFSSSFSAAILHRLYV